MTDPGDDIKFFGGWKGVYVLILVSGAVQLALLYLFTRYFNHP